MITLQRLKEFLHYNPESGIWTWIKVKLGSSGGHRVNIGDRAGSLQPQGYWQIGIDGKVYRSHRLAWFYMTGEWPHQIDHKDMDKSNNKWDNLRLSDHSGNFCNRGISKNNTTGFKGVYKKKNKFEVRIQLRGKVYRRDGFLTAHEAALWHADKAREIHGEFARVLGDY